MATRQDPQTTNLQKLDTTKNIPKAGTTITTGKPSTTNTQTAAKQPSSTTTKNPPSATKGTVTAKGTVPGGSTSRVGVKGTGTPQANKGKTMPGSGS